MSVGRTGRADARLDNMTAIAEPTPDDDEDAGYEAGSRWLWVTALIEFTCLDATAGAAVWIAITSPAARVYAQRTFI